MAKAALVAIVAGLALAGCSSAENGDLSCPPKNTLARVTSIDGDEVRVEVLSPTANHGPAVLHTAGADFFYIAGDVDCFESEREMLTVGQEIEFFADAWMESYPPQAHVDAIIVRG